MVGDDYRGGGTLVWHPGVAPVSHNELMTDRGKYGDAV